MFWNRFLKEPLERIDRESREFLARPESRCFDWKVFWVMVTAAVVLTLQNYFGGSDDWGRLAGWLRGLGLDGPASRIEAFMDNPEHERLHGLTYWALFSFVTYFFLPLLVIRIVFREQARDYGLKLKGAFKEGWVYIVFFAVMLPLLLLVSRNAHFQRTYPFYQL